MSSDQSSGPRSSVPGKKLSLKELAEKAKNTPTPPPVSVAPPPARPAVASVAPAAPAAPEPPVSAAPPPPSAPPSSAPTISVAPAPVVSIEEARTKKKGKKKKAAVAAAAPVDALAPKLVESDSDGFTGPLIGFGLALAGIAAGGFFYYRSFQKPAPPVVAKTEAPVVQTAAPREAPAVVAEVAPEKKSDAVNLDALPAGSASAEPVASAQQVGSAPVKPVEVAANDPKFNPEIKANGTLDQAIEKAAGGPGSKHGPGEDAAPAANNRNQTIPEKPSQGKVASAVGGVMGGAKACVAGAEDVSRATITFGSSGKATNVSVSGWAASHGQSGCVKSALMGANVGAFSDPSFAFSVTIRP